MNFPRTIAATAPKNSSLTDRETVFKVCKRDGRIVLFKKELILQAIAKAYIAQNNLNEINDLDEPTLRLIESVTEAVVRQALDKVATGNDLNVEIIQDLVELQLMEAGQYQVAKCYILYRQERNKARAFNNKTSVEDQIQRIYITNEDGSSGILDGSTLKRDIELACSGLEEQCRKEDILSEVTRMLYDGVKVKEIDKALIFAARSRIEKDPAYSYVCARLLLRTIYREVFGRQYAPSELEEVHRDYFNSYLKQGVKHGRINPELLNFDLSKIASTLKLVRDRKFQYLGIQTIYDRYLLHHEDRRIETPQYFWMRVAMGLALNEDNREERAIEFYDVLSQFNFVSSTPTLFNSGTLHSQLSSCYLSTVQDDLGSIFKLISDNAQLSKWAGGLGNDWTAIRATGARIKGTNGRSQGVIPFLKVSNDTLVAVNQGGKRKGAGCAYLETWHLDIEAFLDLRKNTGDDRRRTHDMNTANWIPDLFMKRVQENGQWTLFSPGDVPELHDLYGKSFEKKYLEYERMAGDGQIKLFKRVDAVTLWRKMLSMLFETGHPWITFKDPSNIRSPQDHAGVVHSSNLCTEILLNTSKEETAVCNLGSVNLAGHIKSGGLDEEKLAKTIRTAIRMLDNVIDINFYPTAEAKNSNLKHRPVGLGLMGFQDALYKLGISYASPEAIEFADISMEMISYYAILASSELAKEKGAYQSYKGSKWDRGLLPIDTIGLLEQERGEKIEVNRKSKMDWEKVRFSIKENGLRNSNTMAIAPTATIANISGVTQSIEPMYKHLFSKSNLSGDFTIVNIYLVEDLKARGLWDDEMVDDLKYFDGSVNEIERVPEDLKKKYLCAFDIDYKWIIGCAAARQKWIDMGQSLNLYIARPNGKKLHDMYFMAWKTGLKTTYYLRSLAATQVEKSTQDINKRGLQPRWMKSKSASGNIQVKRGEKESSFSRAQDDTSAPKACSILDPDCEACQ